MTPFAWILGLFLPACGADGAGGLPVPQPMDMTRIVRPASPNTWLAGPAKMTPPPDMTIPPVAMPADALYQKAKAVFTKQPRTYVAADYPKYRQIHFVVRSEILNYPDLVTVEVDPDGPTHATMTIWSRSVYGHSDLGVNKARIEAWLATLKATDER
jgi:uncharacterized protein (DUF1499 family)